MFVLAAVIGRLSSLSGVLRRFAGCLVVVVLDIGGCTESLPPLLLFLPGRRFS